MLFVQLLATEKAEDNPSQVDIWLRLKQKTLKLRDFPICIFNQQEIKWKCEASIKQCIQPSVDAKCEPSASESLNNSTAEYKSTSFFFSSSSYYISSPFHLNFNWNKGSWCLRGLVYTNVFISYRRLIFQKVSEKMNWDWEIDCRVGVKWDESLDAILFFLIMAFALCLSC